MAIKDPDYVMLTMTKYGTLEHLEGLDTQQRYKGAGGELVTKRLNYRKVFGNQSIKNIKLTTRTIRTIVIFQLRGLGIQSIGPTGVMPNFWN